MYKGSLGIHSNSRLDNSMLDVVNVDVAIKELIYDEAGNGVGEHIKMDDIFEDKVREFMHEAVTMR